MKLRKSRCGMLIISEHALLRDNAYAYSLKHHILILKLYTEQETQKLM